MDFPLVPHVIARFPESALSEFFSAQLSLSSNLDTPFTHSIIDGDDFFGDWLGAVFSHGKIDSLSLDFFLSLMFSPLALFPVPFFISLAPHPPLS